MMLVRGALSAWVHACLSEYTDPQSAAHLQTDRAVKSMVSTLLNSGLESLKTRFGVAK